MRARDLLRPVAITVTPETPLVEARRLFTEHRLHGVPVVDQAGVICGSISAVDLFRDQLAARPASRTVADAMNRNVVTVAPGATAYEVANIMLAHGIHRVLVCEAGVLHGVLTTFDLLRALPADPPLANASPHGARRTAHRS